MKRFIIVASIVVCAVGVFFYAMYYLGVYVDLNPHAPTTAVFRTEGKDLLRQTKSGAWEAFELRGVDLSSSIPGQYATDYAMDPDDYLRWLGQISAMGANAIRVYTILDADFYQAFYDYNTSHEEPLYLLQGIQVSDSANYGAEDIYQSDFLDALLEDGLSAVDIIHGKKIISLGNNRTGTGIYHKDISPWVIGYIVGHEWDSGNIAYTNQSTTHPTTYQGTYFTTKPEASRFEAAIAQIMDRIVSYETTKYKTQRLISFVNDPANDPFTYDDLYAARYLKYNQIDAENISPTEQLLSGYFVSYRLYSFCPDFMTYFSQGQKAELEPLLSELDTSDLYHGYLDLLGRYHTIPVVAAGYGFSTSRAATFEGEPPLTEQEQGEALVNVWQDATRSGWSGVFISTWQDVWERRTWNTAHAIYDDRDPTWQDMQTDGQCYGLLEFHLGEEDPVCYVDGDASEWTAEDVVWSSAAGNLSMKYDEKYLYFYVEGTNFDPSQDILYIPMDTTPKSGSTYCENYDLTFSRPCDFVLCIDGEENSRILVQERYETLWAMFSSELSHENAYSEIRSSDSSVFQPISLLIERSKPMPATSWNPALSYETGALRYGNANPTSADFDSLADYMFTDNGVEIRIPWQLLNFSNPSEMMIHDDYYEHYGVENLPIEEMFVGLALGETEEEIPLASFPLEGWGKHVTYHERLKESYYILQDYWAQLDR